MNEKHPPARARAAVAFGVVDLLLAGIYIYVFVELVPSRSGVFTAVAELFAAVMAAGGVGMFFLRSWGRRLATISAGLMVLVCLVLLALLVASAAYLHGIYGGVGQAGVVLALIAALLTFQLVGLVPALQLAYLWRTRRDG